MKAQLKLLNLDNYLLTSVRLMSFILWPASSRMFLMLTMTRLDWASTKPAQVRPSKAFPLHSDSSHRTALTCQIPKNLLPWNHCFLSCSQRLRAPSQCFAGGRMSVRT